MVWCLLSPHRTRSTSRHACGGQSICYAFLAMNSRLLEEAAERAERALLRVERAIERGAMHKAAPADPRLREKVAAAIAELDRVIEGAGRG